MVGFIDGDLVEVAVELTEVCWELDDFCAVDEFFVISAVVDDLGDGAGFKIVSFLVFTEVTDCCHGAVLVHDFADDSGWL